MVLVDAVRTLWTHRFLAFRLAERDISSRWRGSLLGPLWGIASPLLLLAVYSFVFGLIFKSRWPSVGDRSPPFALVLFSGLILFQLFSETVNAAPGVVRGNASFVKQIVFPLEILPFVGLLVAMFNAGVSSLVLLAGYLILFGIPPLTVLWLPVIALPLPFFALGVAWFLAALGTFVRDTVQITALLTTILMFMSPVFYSLDGVPESYRAVVRWNPLTTIINDGRAALFFDVAPSPWPLVLATLGSLAAFELGFRFFRHMKDGFADVV
ncbi:MAG: ABC transporter permease [Phycisphaerae bacterium]|nr:ABC transporter permease [Phycisphaerae bacterium]